MMQTSLDLSYRKTGRKQQNQTCAPTNYYDEVCNVNTTIEVKLNKLHDADISSPKRLPHRVVIIITQSFIFLYFSQNLYAE